MRDERLVDEEFLSIILHRVQNDRPSPSDGSALALHIDAQHDEINRLREVLEWYADEVNINDLDDSHGYWSGGNPDTNWDDADWNVDRGDRARAALKDEATS